MPLSTLKVPSNIRLFSIIGVFTQNEFFGSKNAPIKKKGTITGTF